MTVPLNFSTGAAETEASELQSNLVYIVKLCLGEKKGVKKKNIGLMRWLSR